MTEHLPPSLTPPQGDDRDFHRQFRALAHFAIAHTQSWWAASAIDDSEEIIIVVVLVEEVFIHLCEIGHRHRLHRRDDIGK